MHSTALFSVLLVAAGFLPQTDEKAAPKAPGGITAEALMRHVNVLASKDFAGRGAGTEGGEMAAAYMAQQFKSVGLLPAGTKEYRQRFDANGGLEMCNVVGKLEGSDATLKDEVVVLGAHFDHLGTKKGALVGEDGKRSDAIYFGADDNASGCAALLEVARALHAEGGCKRTVVCVAFDGEELRLLGSKYFVKNPTVPKESIAAMINMDMVSRGAEDHVCISGASKCDALKSILEIQAKKIGLRLEYQFDEKWRNASDHGPFGEAKIPYLYFGVEDHDDYHQPTDTPDKIEQKRFETIARLVLATARAVADAPERPRFKGKP